MSSSLAQVPAESGQCICHAESGCSPGPRLWEDVAMTLAAPCVSLGLAGIPAMMTACQGQWPWYKAWLFVADGKHNWSHLLAGLASQALGLEPSGGRCSARPTGFSFLLGTWKVHLFVCPLPPWSLPASSLEFPRPRAQFPAVVAHGAALFNPRLCCFWTSLRTVILAAFLGARRGVCLVLPLSPHAWVVGTTE